MSEFVRKGFSFQKLDENNNKIAHIMFPKERDGVYNVKSTFVDESLRGQGVANKLMDELVDWAKEEDVKLMPTCSFAQKWLEKHPEEKDLFVE